MTDYELSPGGITLLCKGVSEQGIKSLLRKPVLSEDLIWAFCEEDNYTLSLRYICEYHELDYVAARASIKQRWLDKHGKSIEKCLKEFHEKLEPESKEQQALWKFYCQSDLGDISFSKIFGSETPDVE